MYRTTALTALILTILAAGFFGVSPTFGVDPEPIRTAMLPRAHAATPESQPFSQGKPAVGVYLLGLRVGLRTSEPFREVEPAVGAADGLVFLRAAARDARGRRAALPAARGLSESGARPARGLSPPRHLGRVSHRGIARQVRSGVRRPAPDELPHRKARLSQHREVLRAFPVRRDRAQRLCFQERRTPARPDVLHVRAAQPGNPGAAVAVRQPGAPAGAPQRQQLGGGVPGRCRRAVRGRCHAVADGAKTRSRTIARFGSCSTARNSRIRRCRRDRDCRSRNATSSAPRWWGPGPPNRRRNCARNGTPPTGLSPRPTRNTPVFPTISAVSGAFTEINHVTHPH